MCERELETEQNCNILTPTLLAITAFLFCSPGLLNRGPGGSASLGHVPQSSIFSQLVWSPNWLIGSLRTPSAGFWLSLPHLVSNWLNFLSTELYNSSRPASSCGRHSCTHSTHPRSKLYSAIPRQDAPVIYTGAFPILTARPGRWSVYNRISACWNANNLVQDLNWGSRFHFIHGTIIASFRLLISIIHCGWF